MLAFENSPFALLSAVATLPLALALIFYIAYVKSPLARLGFACISIGLVLLGAGMGDPYLLQAVAAPRTVWVVFDLSSSMSSAPPNPLSPDRASPTRIQRALSLVKATLADLPPDVRVAIVGAHKTPTLHMPPSPPDKAASASESLTAALGGDSDLSFALNLIEQWALSDLTVNGGQHFAIVLTDADAAFNDLLWTRNLSRVWVWIVGERGEIASKGIPFPSTPYADAQYLSGYAVFAELSPDQAKREVLDAVRASQPFIATRFSLRSAFWGAAALLFSLALSLLTPWTKT